MPRPQTVDKASQSSRSQARRKSECIVRRSMYVAKNTFRGADFVIASSISFASARWAKAQISRSGGALPFFFGFGFVSLFAGTAVKDG